MNSKISDSAQLIEQVNYTSYKETKKNTLRDYHMKCASTLSYIHPEDHVKIQEIVDYLIDFHSSVLSTERNELDTKITNYDELVSRISLSTRLLHRYFMNYEQAMQVYTTLTTEIILALLQSTTQTYRAYNLLEALISCANTSKLMIQQLLSHQEIFIQLIENHKWKVLKLFSILISSHEVNEKLIHFLSESILTPLTSSDKTEKFIHLLAIYLRYIDDPVFIINSLYKLHSMYGNEQFSLKCDAKDEEILLCLLYISKKIEYTEENYAMISDIAHFMLKHCLISIEATKLIQIIIIFITSQSRSFAYFFRDTQIIKFVCL